VEHDARTTTKFLEDEIICRFGIPKYILTNNGGEWAIEFDSSIRITWHYTPIYNISMA